MSPRWNSRAARSRPARPKSRSSPRNLEAQTAAGALEDAMQAPLRCIFMKRLLLIPLLVARIAPRRRLPAGSAPAAITKEGDLVILTLETGGGAKPAPQNRRRSKSAPCLPTRLFSGDVVTPLAAERKTQSRPVLGGTLDEVLRLADLQAAADGRILQAQVQIDAAKIAVERAQKMLSAEAGSARNVDEAKATLSTLAEAALTTAKAQRELLGAHARPRRSRKRGVRVAIYSGEAALLDAKAADASVRLFPARNSHIAKPVAGPPTANAL
jgi:hypothetical protein